MSIGDFIVALSSADDDAHVTYDFCSLLPTTFCSYRGYYDQLALGYSTQSGKFIEAGKLIQLAKDCINKTFIGYKGGEYIMNASTPLWVSNYNEAGNRMIVDIDVICDGQYVTIKTVNEED